MKSFSKETLNLEFETQNRSQCSKLFYSKVSSGFLPQDSQSSYSFSKIQNVGGLELSEEKNLVFHWTNISYFGSTYIFLLVLLFIS